MAGKKGKIFVGTSGWHYKHWIGRFYPEKMVSKDLLDYYDSFFDTLELILLCQVKKKAKNKNQTA